jgi:hypothetical protein
MEIGGVKWCYYAYFDKTVFLSIYGLDTGNLSDETGNTISINKIEKDVKYFQFHKYLDFDILARHKHTQSGVASIETDIYDNIPKAEGLLYNKLVKLYPTKYLPSFLQWRRFHKDNKFVLILAGSGIGKTSFLEKLVYDIHWNYYNFLFTFINFGQVQLYPIQSEPLTHAKKQEEKLKEKSSLTNSVLLLDSFDESNELYKKLKDKSGVAERNEVLKTELENLYTNFKDWKTVIVTCREQLLSNFLMGQLLSHYVKIETVNNETEKQQKIKTFKDNYLEPGFEKYLLLELGKQWTLIYFDQEKTFQEITLDENDDITKELSFPETHKDIYKLVLLIRERLNDTTPLSFKNYKITDLNLDIYILLPFEKTEIVQYIKNRYFLWSSHRYFNRR